MKQVKVFHGNSHLKIEVDDQVNTWIKNNYSKCIILDIQFSENPYGAHIMVVFDVVRGEVKKQ